MSVPVWPLDLPQFVERQGFSEGFADGRLMTKMDAGPPKRRRRFSSAVRPIQASVRVSVDGKMRFRRFWDEETASGTLPFLMPDPTADGLALIADDGARLLDQDGRPLLDTAWLLVLFGETPPSATNTAGAWYLVTFSLSVLP